MALELVPPDHAAQAALQAALALVPLDIEPARPASSSPWRLAAVAEGVDREPAADDRYAPSPRSTRGATRA
jgi:hypothetical protein